MDDLIDLQQRMSALQRLSTRERQVLALRATGTSIPEIAATLIIEPRTVKFHLGNIYTKLGLERLSQGERQLELARHQSVLVGLAGADGVTAAEPEDAAAESDGVVAEPRAGALLVALEDEELIAPSRVERRSGSRASPQGGTTWPEPQPRTAWPGPPPLPGVAPASPTTSASTSFFGGLAVAIAVGAVAAVAVLSTGRGSTPAATAPVPASEPARTAVFPKGRVIEGPLSKAEIEASLSRLKVPETGPDRPTRPIPVPRAPSAPPAPPAPPAERP